MEPIIKTIPAANIPSPSLKSDITHPITPVRNNTEANIAKKILIVIIIILL